MKDMGFKVFIIVLAVCFSIGAVIDYFTAFHWLPAGLMLLFAILVNGVAISIEDRQPDDWEHVGNDNPVREREYKKMIRIQVLCTITVFILGLVSFAYTSN